MWGTIKFLKGSSLVSKLIILSDILSIVFVYFSIRQFGLKANLVYINDVDGKSISNNIFFDWFFFVAAGLIIVSLLKGHYRDRRPIWSEIPHIFNYAVIAFIVDIFVLSAARAQAGWAYCAFSWIALIVVVSLFRIATKHFLLWIGVWQIQSVVIGDDDNALEAMISLKAERLLGYSVTTLVWMGSQDVPAPIKTFIEQDNILLTRVNSDIQAADRALGKAHGIVAASAHNMKVFEALVDLLIARSRSIDVIPPIRGMPLAGLHVSHMFGRELVMMHPRDNLCHPMQRLSKRAFDLCASAFLLTLLSPLFLILVWLIRREDGGSGFYSQERVGKNGKLFACLKFRSMHVNAEQILLQWKEDNPDLWQAYVDNNFKLHNDPRITRIGHFIRRTSIDELPQLINVIRGEMSLVGPRPILPREVEYYGTGICHYYRVFPGITGLWQISGRSATSFADRSAFDQWYIKNWSLWCDIVIMLRTVSVVILRSGAY